MTACRPTATKACAVLLALLLGAGAGSADPSPTWRIRGLSHVAFRVTDLKKSRFFYRDFLGLPEEPPSRGGATDAAPALFRINGRQSLEIRPGLDPAEDRLDHVAFEVDDLQAARLALVARAVPTSGSARGLVFRDTEGHALELTEAPPPRADAVPRPREDDRISRRLLHVGLLVGELDVTRAFYEALGFHEIWRGSRSGTELSWTNMKVPDGEDYVEFMLYAMKPAPHERGTQHHVCLEVPDIEAARAILERRATSSGYSRPLETRIGTNRRRQMNLYDPDGTRVELMEPRTVDGQPVPSSTAPPPRPGSTP